MGQRREEEISLAPLRTPNACFFPLAPPLLPLAFFMNLRRIPLAQLIPAPYNPRVALKPGMPGYRKLARSLQEFDLVQPLVWNERTGHVVGGHQRLEILKANGVAEVEVVVVDLPLSREKALNIALNNSLVGGQWDAVKLVDLVEELQLDQELDATLTGFTGDELRDLLLTPEDLVEVSDDEQDEPELVSVQLEIEQGQWDAVRIALDALIEAHGVRVHVRK